MVSSRCLYEFSILWKWCAPVKVDSAEVVVVDSIIVGCGWWSNFDELARGMITNTQSTQKRCAARGRRKEQEERENEIRDGCSQAEIRELVRQYCCLYIDTFLLSRSSMDLPDSPLEIQGG